MRYIWVTGPVLRDIHTGNRLLKTQLVGFDRLRAACITDRSATLLCAAALALLVPLAFAPALNDYLLSDSFRIVGLIDFPAALQYFHDTTGFGRNEFRPLIPLSYAVDQMIWGDQPFGYHLTSVLIHTANSVLMFLIFLRLTKAVLPGFVAGVLFAMQPAHHSRVAWIAARDSAVCLFFLLICWLAYLHTREREQAELAGAAGTTRGGRRLLRGVSLAAFLLALMSYEGAVAFPLVLMAMETMVYGDGAPWRQRLWRAVKATLPLLALTAIYVAWWLLLFRGSVGSYDLLITVKGMAANFYRLHYRLFYHVQHWLGLAYLLAFYWLWRERKTLRPLLGFSIALIWIGYLPYMHVRGFADRFTMLSAVGAALLLGLCATSVAQYCNSRRAAVPGLAIVPLALILLFSGYYAWGTGRRMKQWVAAGEKAEALLAQLQQMHPAFPEDATLLLDRIPTMHENAYVFPTGLEAAIRRRYRQELPEIHYFPAEVTAEVREQLLNQKPSYHFRYMPEQGRLVQISAPDRISANR